jgi:hypothetical protein
VANEVLAAGTNWLQTLEVICYKEPEFFRQSYANIGAYWKSVERHIGMRLDLLGVGAR